MELARTDPALGRGWQRLRTCMRSSNRNASSSSSSSSTSSCRGNRTDSTSNRSSSRDAESSTSNTEKSRSHRSSADSSPRSSSRSSSTSGGRRHSVFQSSRLVFLSFLAKTFLCTSSVVALSLRTADTAIFFPPALPKFASPPAVLSPFSSNIRPLHVKVLDPEAGGAAPGGLTSVSSSSLLYPTSAFAVPAFAAPAVFAATAAATPLPRAAVSPSAAAAASSFGAAAPGGPAAASSTPLTTRTAPLQAAASASSVPLAFCAAAPAALRSAAVLTRTRGRTRARLFAAPATSTAERPQEGVAGGPSPGRSFMKPRIVCTGVGVVNGVGVGIEEFWANIVSGKNVIGNVTRFDTTGMACQVACEVPDSAFDPSDYFSDPKEVKRNDRYSHFAMAAARLAMEDAGLGASGAGLQRDRFGVVIGSGIGGLQWMEQELRVLLEKGPRRVSPLLIPAMIANTASAVVAIEMKAEGPNHGAVSACATSGHAAGTALRYLQAGEADIILCGGAEASITPLSFAGFNAMRAMAQGFNNAPQRASRPFDRKRAGFVMGEGAGVLVLETEEHAVRRGASKIYGEVAGYGATCDAHHVTAPAPDGAGLARCLEIAIKEAGVDKADVRYINAHGTSTPMNDRIETRAFKSVFGEEGARKLLISSTKSMTGHCLGATGGIEACVAAKVLETGVVPPTINYEEPDPDCDLNYVPNEAYTSPTPFEAVLSDTLGFGGHNAALVLRRYRGQRQ